ncbi:hypothetical protein [Mesobacillus maritimus]|uniref:hypothetical protein n=1 Tax=Mesobacillus maritimus TaxID=1643336 RepID=UPI00384DB527
METYNQNGLPPIRPYGYGSDTGQVKSAHDEIDVYVNDEFIGKKMLLTQTEDANDIGDFLKLQGVENVTTEINGDHYVIKSDNPERLKQVLEVYLQNR